MVVSSIALRANVAQALVNVLFGASSVVSKLALSTVNPVLFGLVRAVVTTVVLVGVRPSERLLCCGRLSVRQEHVARFVVAGFCLFVGEFFYILGVELAGSIRASLWQPSQPIFTMAITALLGHERMSLKKGLGLVAAFAGCAVMVLGSAQNDHKHGGGAANDERSWLGDMIGNACLFVNCSLGTPLYIVSVKPLLAEYPPFACAGLTFALNSMCFLAAMACAPFLGHDGRAVTPPDTALTWAAVLYVAIFATVVPYALQLWATKILPASLVSAYYVLQPLAAAALVYALRALHLVHLPGAEKSDLGAIAVLVGLVVVIRETPTEPPKPRSEDEGHGFLDPVHNGAHSPTTHNAVLGQVERGDVSRVVSVHADLEAHAGTSRARLSSSDSADDAGALGSSSERGASTRDGSPRASSGSASSAASSSSNGAASGKLYSPRTRSPLKGAGPDR